MDAQIDPPRTLPALRAKAGNQPAQSSMKKQSDFWDRARLAAESLEKLRARKKTASEPPNGFDDRLSSRPTAEEDEDDPPPEG